MGKQFNGNVVVITGGGGRNIGRSLAICFAREGAKTVLIGRSEDALRAVAREVESMGQESLVARADVSREAQVQVAFDAAVERFGTVDILINNAAVYLKRDTVDTAVAEWEQVLGVNLTGPFLCSRAALKIMIPQGRGRIIHISSMAGKKALATRGAYCASKFGLLGLSEAMAAEVQGTGIHVNTICPGDVSATPNEGPAKTRPGAEHPNLLSLESHPMVHPDEIAEVAMFLASEKANAIRGQTINVYAGQTLTEA